MQAHATAAAAPTASTQWCTVAECSMQAPAPPPAAAAPVPLRPLRGLLLLVLLLVVVVVGGGVLLVLNESWSNSI